MLEKPIPGDAEELLFNLLLEKEAPKPLKQEPLEADVAHAAAPRPPLQGADAAEALFDALLATGAPTEERRDVSARTGALSSLQERMWLLHQLEPDNTAYIIPCHLRLRGRLDTSLLQEAIQLLWRRHDALRTVFPVSNGQPRRLVLPGDALTIHEYDLGNAEDHDTWKKHYLAHHAGPLQLDTGPLFRVCLYKIAPEEHALLLDIHHINGDGVSLEILRRELFMFYEALLAGHPPALPAPGASYTDYVEHEAALRENPDHQRTRDRRVQTLSGAPTRIHFQFDKPLPAKFAYHGQAVIREYDNLTLLHRAFESGQRAGVSPFMVMLAAYGIALHLHTGQKDLLIGVPLSLRTSERFERTVGFFVNTGVVRLNLDGSSTLTEVMKRTRQAVSDMLSCPELPLEHLVRALRDKRTPDRPPLIQAVLSFITYPAATQSAVTGLAIEPIYLPRDSAMFELTMDIILEPDRGICGLEYSTDVWEEPTIRRLLDQFHVILGALADRPDSRVSDINLLPSAARAGLAGVLEGQPLEGPVRLVPEWIGEHARRDPANLALICGGASTSYAELERLMSRRRGQLAALGLKSGAVLALVGRAGPEWTAIALAALAEGIVVLPLDPNTPAARLRYILENSHAALLWHDDSFSPAALGDHPPCPLLHGRAAPPAAPQPGPAKARPDSTAYIIYTSGTTGQPKGVRVSHGAFEAHCRSAIVAYGLKEKDRALVFAPAHFDAAWEQLFMPLVAGASALIRDAGLWAPEELCCQLAQARVTCADLPPQYVRELLFFLKKRPDSVPPTLRLLITGGEPLPSSLAQAWRESPLGHVPLINAYGPTEAVVTSTFNRIGHGSRLATANGVVPIGEPMPGRVLRILDESGREVGAGLAGELCIGGPCLADGYQGDEGRSGQAFRHWRRTPAGGRWLDDAAPGSLRLYRSGDRVRIGPDNRIEFLGRSDNQIKIRGFRIEPAEIEAVLSRHPAIAQARVMGLDDPVQGKRLVAYCIPADSDTPGQGELVEWLSQWLPDYMLPSATVFVPEFPTTTSGKLDPAALPEPEIRRETKSTPAAAPGGLEAKIAAIWADVLGRSELGLDDNFFDVGGHSLLLVRVHTRLVNELGAKVRLVDLFAHPTVARMAKLLQGAEAPATARRRRTHCGEVAVIGLAGRFPGAANVDELWANLAAGKESIRFFTPEELAAAGVPPSLRMRPDYVPAQGYLEGVQCFDAAFFGYTPREAELIDPQHRLFLEEAWHALESAGYDPERYAGDIAVYGGMGLSLYLLDNLGAKLRHERGAEAFAISLANDKDFITTRVSYKLNLRGPSVNVNTACSTSLVAIHLAAEALLRGECDMALAGGVTLHLPPVSGYVYQPGGIASPDGHCRAFADDAAGTVGGSGAAVVVLKRLEQARADGDHIHAVIKGSAINNDGADKVGFTAPGVNRQRDVIRAALDSAGIGAGSVQYIEAHGTGTPMGDPIEIQALSEAFAPDRPQAQSCYIGSIKSNLGHLDTAAGVAGFIKAVLALEHGRIPPSLHCARPSAKIGFERTPFRVAQQLMPWPETVRRRAGVSSFGMGGTNAHVVLEEAPAAGANLRPRQDVWCIPISARSAKSLLAFAGNLARHLEEHPALDAADLWFTLAAGRRRFATRAVVLAVSRTEAAAALRALREADLLFADRDGKALSGKGHSPAVQFADQPSFAGARAFAAAWLTGEPSAADTLLPPGRHQRLPLPTYVFDREVYWVEPSQSAPEPAPAETEVPAKLPVHEWFYFPSWERVPARRDESAADAPILILHHGSAVETRWMDALRAAKIKFTACTGGRGLESALAGLARREGLPAQCWHLAALGFAPAGPENYARRLHALLADIRALAAARREQPTKLLLPAPQTGGPDAAPVPDFAYLDAAGAVIPHEYGTIAVKVLHIDPAAGDETALRMACSVAGLPDNDRILALWDGKLWRRIFSPLPDCRSENGAARLKPGGVYLITGGLGGMGLTFAGQLARTAKARLVLISRHEPDATQREALRTLEAVGAQVRTAVLDLAEAGALRALVDDVCARWGRIDGVIHAAGVAGGSLVARTQPDEIERVLRAKVAGTEALADVLQGREPAFVILCSSLTASLGGAGQIAYAAANTWMDAFAAAQSRRRPGVWTSVQWDSWAEVGMAARAGASMKTNSAARALLKEWTITPAAYWPWGEHRIGGVATLPGTAYLELFVQALGAPVLELGTVMLVEPLVAGGEDSRTVQVLREGDELIIQTSDGTHVREHARARHRGTPAASALEPLAAILARCPEPLMQNRQEPGQGIVIEAGPRWTLIGDYRKGRDETIARLELPARFTGDLAEHPLHPALLDIAISHYIAGVEGGTGLLPWRYATVRVVAPLERIIFSHVRLRSRSERSLVLDADLRDPAGRLLVQIEGYTLLRVGASGGAGPARPDNPAFPANPFALTPAEGADVFLRALDAAEPVVCISTVAWKHADRPAPLPGTDDHRDEERAPSTRKLRPEIATPFRAAATEAEKLMAGVWEEVLGYEHLGMEDDLFDLGADSLTALQASARLQELTGRDLSLERFFARATIAHLAEDLPAPFASAPAATGESWEEGEL
ncbi:MAG: amino acid adenylation domain-containing protein [Opitutaceae bacterium]|nr:amino acid adenylation domain-containing protein [Opitutaceae bacterium]